MFAIVYISKFNIYVRCIFYSCRWSVGGRNVYGSWWISPCIHNEAQPERIQGTRWVSLHIHLSNLCPLEEVLTLKRVTGMCGRKGPPFHAPSAAPQDPLFSILQFHKTLILTKNHKIFHSKCLTLANFQLPILKMGQNPIQEASVWAKKSVLKTAFCKKKISSTSLQI